MRGKLSIVALAVAVSVIANSVVASTTTGVAGDGMRSIVYNQATGAFTVSPDGQPVGLYDILSDTPIFNATPANIPPSAPILTKDTTTEKGWAAFQTDAFTTDFNLGLISAPGLTQDYLNQHLSITFSGGFGSPTINGDLIVVSIPEPTSATLFAFAAMIFGMQRSQKRSI